MSAPLRYRRRPLVIDAFQMTAEHRWSNTGWPDWLNRAWTIGDEGTGGLFPGWPSAEFPLKVVSLEGVLTVNENDWIVRGVAGELYPVNPDIFERTYAPVVESDPQAEFSELARLFHVREQAVVEAIRELLAMHHDHPIDNHQRADEIVCEVLSELGAGTVADAFRDARKRLPFGYYD